MQDKLKRFWASPLCRILSIVILTLIIIIAVLSVSSAIKADRSQANAENISAQSNFQTAQKTAEKQSGKDENAALMQAAPSSQPILSQPQGESASQPSQPQANSDTALEQETDENDMDGQLMLNADKRTIDKLSKALSQNSDTVGWLNIDGTKCDYAVMQSDDNNYYLKRNEKKKKSSRGALFADFRCKFNDNGDISRNTVIYGHSMKDGSMFTQLFSYKKLSVINNQPIIEFSYNGCTQNKWVIFACMVTDINFNYIEPNPNDTQFMSMIDEIKQRSMFNTDISVNKNDNILLLSTCTYEYPDEQARFVVAARQLRENEKAESIKVNARKNEDVKQPEF